MEGAATLIDFQKEIRSKEEYRPTAIETEFDAAVYRQFQYDLWQFQSTYKWLLGLNITDYIRRNQLDYVQYVPPLKDPFDWRSHLHSPTQNDKVNALIAFFQDLNFKCEVTSQDWLGRLSPEMADGAESLIQHADILDMSDEKHRLADTALFVDGTVAEDISWTVKKRLQKNDQGKWKPESEDVEVSSKNEWVESFEGVESRLMKINRVYLGDETCTLISDQPHLFKEYVVTYETAYQMFHDYFKWKYVKPFNVDYDQWTDTDTDVETEGNGDKVMLVRIRIYENLPRNEYAIYCNKVRMTPVGLKMPHNRYSITWTRAAILNPHFAHGESFVAHMRQYSATLDILISLFVDGGRQGLEPPMKSSFRNLINRYAFAPGKITQAQQGTLEPLIPQNAQQNFSFEAIQYLEKRINDSTVSPIFRGETGGVMKTKFEVEQALNNAVRMASNYVAASVWRRKQRAEYFFDEILRHYPSMSFGKLSDKADTLKRFVVSGGQGMVDKEIMFQKMPDTGVESLNLSNTLLKQTMKEKKKGRNVKMIMIDPDEIKNYKFLFDFKVNPQQRDTKSASVQEVERKASVLAQMPLIDPEFIAKMVLNAYGEDPQEAMKKQQQQPQQGQMPGQAQGQVPGQQLQPGQQQQQARPMPPSPPQQQPANQPPQNVL